MSLVLANVAPRHARVVPDTRFFRTHTTCVLKYFLIEHNILNRNARSVGRGDETHHETDQRNEPFRFAGVVTRGTEGGVLVATTRVAFGVEEFDESAVAENRLGEVRDSRVGVLLRVLSGDIQGVGDCG